MSHQCVISISNKNNPYPIRLSEIKDLAGDLENVSPSSFQLGVGQEIGAGDSVSFTLKRDAVLTAGAQLTWTTGNAGKNTFAYIVTTFRNDSLGNKAALEVQQPLNGGILSKLAYGVSYFHASQGNDNEMARDYLNTTDLKHSPVYVNYSIVCNSYVTAAAPEPMLKGITNVVMLMLENRGFDHLMGHLYSEDPKVVFPAGSQPATPADPGVSNPINFDGLANQPNYKNFNPYHDGEPLVPVSPVPQGNLAIPEIDPGEQWADTNTQVFNTNGDAPSASATASMQGFLNSYHKQPDITEDNALQILQYYTSKDLPVMSGLAKNYAVSDAWHCSVPSQTSPNRGFSLAGTSNGYVDNYDVPGIPPNKLSWLEHSIKFGSNTLFNVMANCGNMDWKIYYEQRFLLGLSMTEELFEQLHQYKGTEQISSIEQFYQDLESDNLPAFSYLEPTWQADPKKLILPNDYHPPYNILPGEANLATIYEALTKYKRWDSTLFIVTFDEHGGTFDHAAPPPTIAPDSQTDWSNFKFDRLGVRVPTLLISPRIEQSTVFRSPESTPFDHTSFLKTILGWQNIDISGGVLGNRAAQAPHFSGVVSDDVVNPAPAKFDIPEATIDMANAPLNDLQKFILPLIAQKLSGAKSGTQAYEKVLNELLSKKTAGELAEYARGFEK